MIYAYAITAVLAYLIGSINTSIILSKAIYGSDIRTSGSGNAGATNMLRTHGKGIAIATLVCDVLKGIIAILLAAWLDKVLLGNSSGNLKYIAGIFVALGHDFPIYFGFRGGKGVATSLGVALILDWQIGLIVGVLAILIMAISGYVSLGSVLGAALYPVILIFALRGDIKANLVYIIMAVILALLLIIKHHSNISKLINGTENKLFTKKEDN